MYTPKFARKLAQWAEQDARRDENREKRRRKILERKAQKLFQAKNERHRRYQAAYLKRKAQQDFLWVLAAKQVWNLRGRAKRVGIPYYLKQSELRAFLAQRYPFVCEYCNLPVPNDKISLDHKTPLSRGGHNLLTNLAISCYSCNRIKYTLTAEEFKELTSTERLQKLYAGGLPRHKI